MEFDPFLFILVYPNADARAPGTLEVQVCISNSLVWRAFANGPGPSSDLLAEQPCISMEMGHDEHPSYSKISLS